ncbi:RagB/SusD family nutrient uptake outer membrane protein [Porphyromonadaceae sp. NP-X]|nr:RagB/SusD family nutrient uptake outer membrane protein [Porphyromonadaceae sp. NP-X]NMB82828.1 RagB/SusD family nutrient uptake outer membrane protein [Ignavibacteria bacterium]
MKKYISIIGCSFVLLILCASCNSFLEEEPKTFLSPDFYFTSEAQAKAAVNGLYTFLDDRFAGTIGPGTQTYLFMEYLPGYGDRPYTSSSTDLNQAVNLNVKEDNLYVQAIWETHYKAIENCNSIIEGMKDVPSEIISLDTKNNLLGEVYFFRAYNYFNLVRLFGPIPLKLSSTKDLSNVQLKLSNEETVYSQIENDLLTSDSLMVNNVWNSSEGRVAKGAVESLLAKVYLTMAGYPLQKGLVYYQKAYAYAQKVIASNKFYVFDSYADLRNISNENTGEYIWMIQCHNQYAGSPVHFNLLPYPEPAQPISSAGSYGGALAPTQAFYDSYSSSDMRKAEKGYYYTKHETLKDPSIIVDLGRPYIYKFWDDDAAKTGNSGKNYPLLTYSDVLLICAEAKAQVDGGSTNDAKAIDAYYEVRNRAFPDEGKPVSITTDDVLKERFWEICFEGQTWYDMLRTRKAFNVTTREITDMIGYNAPAHPEGHVFKESDLLFPYPLREKRLNPNLVR